MEEVTCFCFQILLFRTTYPEVTYFGPITLPPHTKNTLQEFHFL